MTTSKMSLEGRSASSSTSHLGYELDVEYSAKDIPLSTDNLDYHELDSFFKTPIEWEKIKKHCSSFIAINSDNDQYVPLKEADVFREKLGAKVIIEHDKGHMGKSDKVAELPSMLEAVKE